MKIAVGSDHRGVPPKERLRALLVSNGHDVRDVGAHGPAGVDYPDFAIQVAELVAAGTIERGILLCATGHGMCIAANKVRGIRAANCRDMVDAEMSRQHNDANVLCLSSELIGDELMERLVKAWIVTPFDGGRHTRRLNKISQYEAR